MATDATKLSPIALCRLLNSTALGEVMRESTLRNHRTAAGHRIGTKNTVDLLRYSAWLILQRQVRSKPVPANHPELGLDEIVAQIVMMVKSRPRGRRKALTAKQIRTIAALLTHSTQRTAARAANVHPVTICRWLKQKVFREALKQGRLHLMQSAYQHAQSLALLSMQTFHQIALQGRRDSDRMRAAHLLLEHGQKGLGLLSEPKSPRKLLKPKHVLETLSRQIQEVQDADLPLVEKTRQTIALTGSFLQVHEYTDLRADLEALEDAMAKNTKKKKRC